jgi:hypothetical protein
MAAQIQRLAHLLAETFLLAKTAVFVEHRVLDS